MKVETRPTTLNLPVELLREAKVYAANHDATLQSIVAAALSEYLKQHKGKGHD